jgi:hypothetical protein
VLTAAALTTLASVSQAAIQFDLRAIPTGTTGAIVNSPKHVLPTAPSGVVKLQLWAMVTNADANNTNDGFHQTHLSILSSQGQFNLNGNLAATTNVTPFNGLGAQLGTLTDLDEDGDLDIGDLRNGAPLMNFFVASTGASPLHWPAIPDSAKAAEAGFSSFLLGTADFNFSSASLGSSTTLNVVPRQRVSAFPSYFHVYIQDNATISQRGSDAGVIAGPGVLIGIPEPSTLALLGSCLLVLLVLARPSCRAVPA